MKRNFVQNSLLASAVALGMTGLLMSPARAQIEDVPITGDVASTLTLEVTNPSGENLDLNANNDTPVKVATLNIHTNNPAGYTLSATITDMVNQHIESSDSIAFSVATVLEDDPTLPAFDPLEGDLLYNTNGANAPGTNARDLYIHYTLGEFQEAGHYSGSIQLTVADN